MPLPTVIFNFRGRPVDSPSPEPPASTRHKWSPQSGARRWGPGAIRWNLGSLVLVGFSVGIIHLQRFIRGISVGLIIIVIIHLQLG